MLPFMMSKHPGDLLRDWRSRNGWTQRQLGDRMGVGNQDICDYERGRKVPSLVRAFMLERITGVDAELWADYDMMLRGKAA